MVGTDHSLGVYLLPLKRRYKFHSRGFDGLRQRMHMLGAMRSSSLQGGTHFLPVQEIQCHIQMFPRKILVVRLVDDTSEVAKWHSWSWILAE